MLANYELWTDVFHRLASQPLTRCTNFAEIAAHHEDWWHCRNAHPLFLAKGYMANRPTVSRQFEKLQNPQQWLEAKLVDFQHTVFIADSMPFIHLDLGANYLACLAGAGIRYGEEQAWILPSLARWNEIPEVQTLSQSSSFLKMQELTNILLESISGRAVFMPPNLGSPADALMNLVGAEKFCQMLIDSPEEVKSALSQIADIWKSTYSEIMDACVKNQVGLIHWCEIWSELPYLILECESAALVGRKHFQQFFVPDIRRQAQSVQRSIFHICGEDAFRHLDSILDIPEINAIQYVPRKGNKVIDRLAEIRRIQRLGIPLQIAISPFEVYELMDVLDPAGLSFLVLDALPLEDLKEFSRLAAD